MRAGTRTPLAHRRRGGKRLVLSAAGAARNTVSKGLGEILVTLGCLVIAGCGGGDAGTTATVTPTVSVTSTPTRTRTHLPTASATQAAPLTSTPSRTASTTPSASPSATSSATASHTHTPTHTHTHTPRPDDTGTATRTATDSPTSTLTPTRPPTETPTLTATTTAAAGDTPTVTPDLSPSPSPTPTSGIVTDFCSLPGSVQSTETGVVVVPGGLSSTDLTFLHLPVGFCAHYYARLGNPRQLRFAPGGDLFVASPTAFTTGGGRGGQSAIVLLPDDDHDGVADSNVTFLSGLPSSQGILFANDYLYYQDRFTIRRLPFRPGDRAPSGASEKVTDITINVAPLHWPKPMDIADDGTIYVGNGGEESDRCDAEHSFRGGVLKLDGTPGGNPVAKGFRNPIALRCRRGLNRCFAVELAKDFTAAVGGREKIVPIRQGDDWGFPCCATKNLAYPGVAFPDCSTVTEDQVQFYIGDTPFDLDFEMGKWPAPWNNRIFVPLHGAYGTWAGARVVSLEFDTTTGELLPGSDLDGMMSTGAMRDFATGWADGSYRYGRPANVAFAPDGRLFLSNDVSGVILWIAPMGLPIPQTARPSTTP